MKMKVTVLISVVFYFIFFAATLSYGQTPLVTCDVAFSGTKTAATNHRALAILERIWQKAGMSGKISLCVWDIGTDDSLVMVVDTSEKAIGVTSHILSHFSDEELRGLLAHEVGHIVYGHMSHGNGDTPKEQQEADTFAVKIAGKNSLRSGLVHWGLSMKEIERRLSRACALIKKIKNNTER